jgi:hypothetical protein
VRKDLLEYIRKALSNNDTNGAEAAARAYDILDRKSLW